MKNMTKEYKSLRTKGERLAFVERAIAEEQARFNETRKRVEPHDPEYNGKNDLYICRQFALGAAVSFNPRTINQVHPDYKGALKPLDVAPNHQIPLRYTGICKARGAFVEEPFGEDWEKEEMDHCINAVQVGDTGKSIDDWVFVEPQGLNIFERNENGGVRYSEMPTIISIAKSVGHKKKYSGEDKWFYGDHLDLRVQFGSQRDRVDKEFLQAYGAKPKDVTSYSDGPLQDLFYHGTERWLASRGDMDKFKERAGKIRVGKPAKGYRPNPSSKLYHGEDGNMWYDVSQKSVIENARAFASLGVVSKDNFEFLKRVTNDLVLHRAFDAGIETPVDLNVLNYFLARAS